jgi:hypothetical protein
MRTFDSLDADFRRAFKQAAKQGIVKFTIEGIKDDPESIYPMFEVSNNHVTYYSVQRQESVCITDMKIKAVIYWLNAELSAWRVNNMIYENDIIGIKVVGYRYGKAPKCGRSYNYRENHYEDGVSMAQVCYYKPVGSFAANGEKKYYYEGVVSGIGSDNEICLSSVKQISYNEYQKMKKSLITESNLITNFYADQKKRLLDKGFNIGMSYEGIEEMRNKYLK